MSSEAPQPRAVGLSVAAAARRLGVAPATLRTWDRRYGLGPSAHEAGSHRRYTAADLARLEHMRRLMLGGLAPADAAREALDLDLDPAQLAPVTALTIVPALAEDAPEPAGRAGGGQVVAIPGGIPAARGLARAAQALDGASCSRIVEETLERRGVVWTWDRLIAPVLVGVGQRWQSTGRGIEVEHVLTEAVLSSFAGIVRSLHSPVNARPVLLAGADDEQHSLPLWALAAALTEHQVGVRMLGGRLPAEALVQSVHRTGPAAIFLWSQIPGHVDASEYASLASFRPAPAVLLGGPGWPEEIPPGMERVEDLPEAVRRVLRALGEL